MNRTQWRPSRISPLVVVLSILVITGLVLSAAPASAQTTVSDRLTAISNFANQLNALAAKMPPEVKNRVSTGGQNLLRLALQIDQIEPALTRPANVLNSQLTGNPFSPKGALSGGSVSDPSTDVAFSRLAGFVQSETSTAWCGDNAVVAFNDSGSVFETLPIPNLGLSFNGYSNSTDGGRTFTDQGFLNPGPNVANFLGGDPVVACTSESTFYYSSIFQQGISTGVSVSRSTDGGKTFGNPVPTVLKSGFFHFLDKPWMTTDPSNTNNLYVSYTDFDFSGTLCPGVRVAIELVTSKDGGNTWSSPVIIDNGCGANQDQGSNIAVDNAGTVYVAWESFPIALPTNELDIVKSTDGGVTFSPKVAINRGVIPVGHSFFLLLQGGFRNNEFPMLAIDRSRPNGPIYAVWNDGRQNITPDNFPFFFGSTYNFGDIFVSRSDNAGASWSNPFQVNNNKGDDDAAPITTPADRYQPGIAVDREGSVGVCFYDRRRDPLNFNIDRECATSATHGQTWRNFRVTNNSFTPSIANDLLVNPVYMGDYDTTAADTLLRNQGFIGAYGDNSLGNPDVKVSRHFSGEADDH